MTGDNTRRKKMPIPTSSRTIVTAAGVEVDFSTLSNLSELLKLASLLEPTDVAQPGDLTVGAAEVEIAITGVTRLIMLRADPANTNTIWIGKTGVQNDGSVHLTYLEPGDDVTLPYNDATNALYAISDAAAQTLSVGALL
jgi:hypothetical protein